MIRVTMCVLTLLLLVRPVGLATQEVHLTPYVAATQGLEGVSPLAGMAATWYPGPLGVRLSGAQDGPSSPMASLLPGRAGESARAWTGDLDVVLSLRRLGIEAGTVDLLPFAGLGVQSRSHADAGSSTLLGWSRGVGLGVPLVSRLSVELEGRHRVPFRSSEQRPAGVGGGWEVRSGVSLRLGSPPRRQPPARPGPAGVGGVLGEPAAPAGRPATLPGAGADLPAPRAGSAVAISAINTGQRYLGVRYRWGGVSPDRGFDCSGFVQYIFARNGIRLPRTTRDQARVGERVDPVLSELRDGDLLFFAARRGVIDHVAIYAGDRTILHSASRRGVVMDRLDGTHGQWYVRNLVAVRRVTGGQ
jgi:hypothetical protein